MIKRPNSIARRVNKKKREYLKSCHALHHTYSDLDSATPWKNTGWNKGADRLAAPLRFQHSTLATTRHSACDDSAKEDDVEAPTGDGGGKEGEDAEEDAEMGAGAVHMVHEAVKRPAWRACVYA